MGDTAAFSNQYNIALRSSMIIMHCKNIEISYTVTNRIMTHMAIIINTTKTLHYGIIASERHA